MEMLALILGIFALSFLAAFVGMTMRMKRMTQAFAEVLISKVQLEAAYNNYEEAKKFVENSDIHTQNFIKFLSDSRDWAFKYIEDVQCGLKNFVNQVQPQIDHYAKYGAVVEGMNPPHDFALKKISKELDELKKFLPQEVAND